MPKLIKYHLNYLCRLCVPFITTNMESVITPAPQWLLGQMVISIETHYSFQWIVKILTKAILPLILFFVAGVSIHLKVGTPNLFYTPRLNSSTKMLIPSENAKYWIVLTNTKYWPVYIPVISINICSVKHTHINKCLYLYLVFTNYYIRWYPHTKPSFQCPRLRLGHNILDIFIHF